MASETSSSSWVKEFSADDFSAEVYTKRLFEVHNEDSARELLKNLQKKKAEVAELLKQNVYKNYYMFISSSKEISSLEVRCFTGCLFDTVV